MQLPSSQRQSTSKTSSTRDSDNQTVMDEHGLLQSFVHRRRRMEAAVRLARNMLGEVTSITETDESAPYILLVEDVAGPDGMPQNTANVNDTSLLSATRHGINGTGKSSNPPEAMLDQEINDKLKRLREMRAEQRTAAEMQVKPAFELAERVSDVPAPPTLFTSTSLAFSLETLGKSVAKIISATDGILVQLSILDKTKSPSIFNEMHTLSLHSQHAFKCYSAALQHLKQYEVCQKALQDGTAEELSTMREQFLMRKEMLTAQEQKQKVVDEHLQAMKLRLNAIDARCRMWSSVLLDIAPPTSAYLPGMSICRMSVTHERDLFLPRSPTLSRPVSNAQRYSVAGSLSQACSNTRMHTPVSTQSIDSRASSIGTSDEFETRVDAMEVKVAQSWTNPYVVKAQRCTERRRCMRRFIGSKTPPLVDVAAASIAGGIVTSGMAIGHSPVSSRRESTRFMRMETPRPVNTHDGAGRAVAETRLSALLRTLLTAAPRMAAGTTDTHNPSHRSSETQGKSGSVESAKTPGSLTMSAEEQVLSQVGSDMVAEVSFMDEVLEAPTTEEQQELNAVMESSRNLLRFLDSGGLTLS
ncbi:uncharacterized protein TM35_000171400 [Trypanosoma theileri]|uniref:Uncharacterized protein n=1 Tax=Trypanosoma theileri TaxID=67003 RepID=A0A1X0NUQ0_9TRYP|nr:uncharacterized protein TM35_000171400 [Trypanosoma theileri]ORC88268.1 hypothetical protein TM35_000171400 [Trypanosoma theileri]